MRRYENCISFKSMGDLFVSSTELIHPFSHPLDRKVIYNTFLQWFFHSKVIPSHLIYSADSFCFSDFIDLPVCLFVWFFLFFLGGGGGVWKVISRFLSYLINDT